MTEPSHSQPDSTDGWKQAQPKLRSDLRFYPQKSNGQLFVVVEDPIRSKYFRIGQAEYLFVSQLDGVRSVEQAFELAAQKLKNSGSDADLGLDNAKEICDFLSRSNLLRVVDDQALQTMADNHEKSKWASRFNPIFQKVPLFSPNRWLEGQHNFNRLIFSMKGLTIWLAVVALAIYLVCQNWLEFYAGSQGILSGYGWLWMVATWILLKAVHEFGHASCCHRFGGNVREFGLAFICFFPVAYVDVTSSWKVGNKWKKIATASAGIYVELFVAALAAIGWFCIDDPMIKSGLYNVMVVASITTVVFNINPLMKFDGYYMLADFVEIPTLYQRSQKSVVSLAQSLVLGNKKVDEHLAIVAYGCAVIVWRVFVCIGIFLTLSVFGEGIGTVFAMAALFIWLMPIVRKISAFLKSYRQTEARPEWKRVALVSLTLLALIAGIGRFFFLPQQIVAHGIVESKDSQIVRAKTDGFVHQIFVKHGQRVEQGTPLVRLKNEVLENELSKLVLDQKRLQLEIEQFRAEGKTSRVISESEMLLKIMHEIEHKQNQVESLLVRAKMDGIACIYAPETLQGTFVEQGDELLTVMDPEQKKISACIPQHQLEGLGANPADHVADTGRFYCPETGASFVQLSSLSPQATLTPINALLCANVGGPLPVTPVAAESPESGDKDFELLEPHVAVSFALDGNQSRNLECGRLVSIRINGTSTSTGYQFYKSARRWLAQKMATALGVNP